MAKDKYSDSHTIDVFNDEQELNIYTSGLNSPILIKAGDPTYAPSIANSDICINAKDDILIWADDLMDISCDGKMVIRTYSSGAAPVTEQGTSTGDIFINASDDIVLVADNDLWVKCWGGAKIANTNDGGTSVSDSTSGGWQTGLIVENQDPDHTGYILKLGSRYGLTSSDDVEVKLWVDNEGNLSADGKVTCANFKMTTDASNGHYLVSDADGDASWFEVDNSVINWESIESDKFTFTTSSATESAGGNGDIILNASSDIIIGRNADSTGSMAESITLEMENSSSSLALKRHHSSNNCDDDSYAIMFLNASGQIVMKSTDDIFLWTPESKITYIRGDVSDSESTESHVCHIRNISESSYADCLKLSIGKQKPGSDNFWLTFNSDCDNGTSGDMEDGDLRGRVRGSDDGFGTESSGSTRAFQTPSVSDITATEDLGVGDRGNCVYASGDSDFGEWFECGNPHEWFQNIEDVEKKLKSKRAYLDLPEGIVVYIRDKKFYRSGPGVPMITTHRALLVGNERPDFQEKPGWLGQILSFVGQVPVYFSGEAKSGDFLIDSGEGYCIPVSPEDVTMKEYVKTIGRALEDADSTKQQRVMCAINYK